jgi:hypothetical protein
MLIFGSWPYIVLTRLSATLIRASAGVMVGIVGYLCWRNTVLQMHVPLVALIYTLWHL